MKAVYVIHRHGARFPSSSQTDNLSFPIADRFWKDHSMELTPQGMQQLKDLGIQLRSYNLPVTKVYSSNTSRTILSAMSLLDGLEPHRPHIIEMGYSRPVGIDCVRIQVEENKMDSLFHLGKKDDNNSWYYNNLQQSDEIRSLSNDPRVIDLLDKLYTVTHCQNLHPNNTDRLTEITKYINLLRYAEVHQSPFLPNPLNIQITSDERELITQLSDSVYNHRFRPHDDDYSNQRGSSRCRMVMDEICRHIRTGTIGMLIYSAHDTTLLSMAAMLGLRIPCPDFASYFVLEVYDDYINVKFNPRPREKSLTELEPIYWNQSDRFIHLDQCINQSFRIDDFCSRFSHINYHILTSILRGTVKPTSEPNMSEVFDYFSRDGVWTEDSIKEIFYRFDEKYPGWKDIRLTYQDFANLFK